jgi:hypothetical protein
MIVWLKRSGLLARIATMESAMRTDKKLTAFLKPETAIRGCGELL